MNEKQIELEEQQVEIRTAIKAGDDNGQMGSGNAAGGSQMGSGH